MQKHRPVKKPFLSVAHKKARLQWCKDHRNWSAKDWEKVIWSDEACVRIGEDNSPAWVFRTAKEKYISDCLRPVFKGARKSIMVWGCFHGSTKSELHCFPSGSIDSAVYQKTLAEGLLSLIEDEDGLVETMLTPSRLIFQQDNAPIHNSISTRRFLERSNIPPMQWPANSPDLNPIENIWFLMKKAFHSKWVAARREKSRNLTTQELENLLLDSWKSIDSDQLLRLVWSMPRRVVAVIKAGGGVSKY